MPQLDTIYIFTVYLWAWTTLILIMRTIKNTTIAKTPKPKHSEDKKPTPTMPWT
uniref:ATP synthase F0 subunit 8 n=1 Tax=Psammophis lineolatus TaxID=224566 RepID=A0A8K1XFK1_9SAUR|nr:ATP synthase F0 subunit 8 [Psammophis lineolatus]UHM24684.1 ATP synthase F0 subunit 8 [Psammophis lineolatus]